MHRYATLVISGLICFFMNSGLFAQLPANYQDLTVREKQDLLWSEVTKSHEQDHLPPLNGNSFSEVLTKLNGLFSLKPTFNHASDELR